MKLEFSDFKYINMLVDQNKNIVIFPISESNFPVEFPDGSIEEKWYLTAYYPIDLKYPYNSDELAEKIRFGIEQWNKHLCHNEKEEKQSYEEKYYGIKGFKNAVKGKLFFNLGWNDTEGKFVSLMLPCKRGYSYLGIAKKQLSDNSDWIDFADAVIEFLNMDLTELSSFKAFKSKLNL